MISDQYCDLKKTEVIMTYAIFHFSYFWLLYAVQLKGQLTYCNFSGVISVLVNASSDGVC